MTLSERSLTAGILSGRLKPRDVKDVDASKFADWTLANIFAIALGARQMGMEPRTDRIIKVMQMANEPTAGVAELVDKLRAEG